jgi:hypothetical protein
LYSELVTYDKWFLRLRLNTPLLVVSVCCYVERHLVLDFIFVLVNGATIQY